MCKMICFTKFLFNLFSQYFDFLGKDGQGVFFLYEINISEVQVKNCSFFCSLPLAIWPFVVCEMRLQFLIKLSYLTVFFCNK